MLWIPMVFMMAVTFTALGMTIVKLSKAFVTTGLDLGNSFTADICSITVNTWRAGCNPGY